MGAGLFIYECFRLLLLVVFLILATPETSINRFCFVYMSSNALFPMMALFIWLRPDMYRNFTTLYIAGKIITLVSFYVWEIFSLRDFIGAENLARNMLILACGILLSVSDILSAWAAWKINKKLIPESGGE